MKGYHFSIILFCILVFPVKGNAKDPGYGDTLKLEHISIGLSQSSATKIFEDQDGFLWIGTPNGINRYDGSGFHVFEKTQDGKTGLTNSYIESIYQDPTGTIYVGTNKGLNIFDPLVNQMKPYDFSPEATFINTKYIGAISKTGDYLWLGTAGNGVYRYNTQTGDHTQLLFEQLYVDGPSNTYIVEIFDLSDNRLLIVTQANVYVINTEMEVISQLPPQNISTAIKVNSNDIWVGTHDGDLLKLNIHPDYSIQQTSTTITPGYSILSITKDNKGNTWIGSENAGLSILSADQKEVLRIKAKIENPKSIQSNSIWSLYCTKNGVVWLGAFKKGLSFYDPNYYKFDHVKTNPFKEDWLSNDIVNCFLEDESGNLWIGTDGGGLNYWDRANNSFQHWSLEKGNLNSDVILTLFKDDQERLWIGTWADGLTILNPKNNQYEVWKRENSFLGSNNVISIIQDHKQRIWIATLFGGIHIYNPKDQSHQHVRIENSQNETDVITAARLLQDNDQNIWIGSQTSGLFKLEEEEEQFKITQYATFEETNRISNDFVNVIFEDSSGNIWVGTQAGLNQFNKVTESFKSYTVRDGLIDDAIKGITEDEEGFLWLSTSDGIIRLNTKNFKSTTFDLYDGLQGNEFNASSSYKTRDQELVFGGNNGFNIFTPDQAKKLHEVPEIYFSSLKIFNDPVTPGDQFNVLNRDISQVDSLKFSNKHSVINFEFRALTFRHPYRVQYAYYLEGFETEWNYVGNDPSATYTNLSPGAYTLKVRSTNSDGIWVDNEKSLFIWITPPYWATWWFNGSLIALVLFGIYSIYLIRIRQIKKYQAQLENEIDERTMELQEKQRVLTKTANELAEKNEEIQRFAFAVSHDLKSPLSTIKGFTDVIKQESSKKEAEKLSKFLNYIRSSCDTMNDLITDITKIAKLGKIENQKELLNTNQIVNTARELVTGRLHARNAELAIQETLPQIFGDKNRMIQVFENLIDNAIKYMGEQKQPLVQIKGSENGIYNKFEVKDNGSGMDEDSLEKLFSPFQRFDKSVEGTGLGLYMIQKIIESHDGKIHAESEGIGKGTTFIIKLPKVIPKDEG